jgi:FHS family L-fucose permease-like MFS transporter
MITQNSATNISSPQDSKNSNEFALVPLTSLFFIWGFITCLNEKDFT